MTTARHEPSDGSITPAGSLTAASGLAAARGLATTPWRVMLPLAGGLVLGIGLLFVVRQVARPLGFLIVAIAIAEALSPVVERLHARMPRSVAIAGVFATLVAAFVALAWLVVPMLIAQGQELLLRAPELVARVEDLVDLDDTPFNGGLANAVSATSQRWAGVLLGLPLKILGAVVDVLVVLFLSVYWLVGAPSLGRFTLSLLPEGRRDHAQRILREAGQAMGGYVRGAAINAVIMGLLAWAGLALIGVKYALALGVLTMFAEPVPIIGPILAGIPVVAIALLQSPQLALGALALYVALQQLEGQLLTPNIMRSQTDMPQTVVLFAVMAGAAVGGLLGILASLPLAAALRVLVLRALVPAVRRWTGAEPRE